ncbi:MAG: flagellar biosynthesis protein FlhF [Fibrobacterales bacterium]
MKMKKFRAATVREALERVKEELGPQAVILKTENLKKGLMGKESEVEVTAALDEKAFVKPGEVVGHAMPAQAYSPRSIGQSRSAVLEAESDTDKQAHNDLLQAIKHEIGAIRDVVLEPNKEIAEIKREIQNLKKGVLNRSSEVIKSVPEDFKLIYHELLKKGVLPDFINEVVAELTIASAPDERNEKFVRYSSKKIVADKLPVAGPITFRENRASIIMFVGSTGVGKTTTIAKLAGQLILQGNKEVGIISTDCYRIGAIEQMSTLASASSVDFEAIFELSDIDKALDNFKDKDVVLIDSAGRSQTSSEHLTELRQIIDIAVPDEIHLVLAANVKVDDMQHIFESFKSLGVSRVLFTKLDETSSHASLVNVMIKNGLPVSYLTFGQKIPDDIMIAEAESFSEIMFEGM